MITRESVETYLSQNTPELQATQTKLCIPIIQRICVKMLAGIKFEEIKVCEDLLIDGHHRYISALLTGYEIGRVNSQKTSATIALAWQAVELFNDDWDTAEHIAILNQRDAAYNKIDLKLLTELTSGNQEES
ncbi:MAG TPA: hypothetical protein VG367_03530 [Mucilaginibacter sp.]|jgi:hypothetical protein|nr:hypothetical protein [Mucilaginibacter sp.]